MQAVVDALFSAVMPASNLRPLLVLAVCAIAPEWAGAVDFKREIQPIFKKHCYECHSEQADKRKAGYIFDDLYSLVNDIGPNGIIVPGDPAESHLMKVLTIAESAKEHMPPDSKPQPSSGEIKKIESWIKDGAHLVNPATVRVQGLGPPPRKWRNREGREIEASFVKLDGANVHFKMTDGRILPYPVEQLTADSQIQVRKALLEAAGEKPLAGQ